MALDSNTFSEIQQRAKKIMDMDRRGELKKYSDKNSAQLLENGEIDFTPTTDLMQTSNRPLQSTGAIPKNAKLPKEILESFATNQINTEGLGLQSSVLDTIGVPQQKPRQVVNENTMKVSKPERIVETSVSQVDYSLIKTIVEDCMRKSLASIKKAMLTESQAPSANKLELMRIGESFKFVTSNGDIYEAKLVKKGNVNERKKEKM